MLKNGVSSVLGSLSYSRTNPYAPCAKGQAALLGGLFERPPFSLYLKVFVAKLNFF